MRTVVACLIGLVTIVGSPIASIAVGIVVMDDRSLSPTNATLVVFLLACLAAFSMLGGLFAALYVGTKGFQKA